MRACEERSTCLHVHKREDLNAYLDSCVACNIVQVYRETHRFIGPVEFEFRPGPAMQVDQMSNWEYASVCTAPNEHAHMGLSCIHPHGPHNRNFSSVASYEISGLSQKEILLHAFAAQGHISHHPTSKAFFPPLNRREREITSLLHCTEGLGRLCSLMCLLHTHKPGALAKG